MGLGLGVHRTLVLYPSWTQKLPSSGRSLAESLWAGHCARVVRAFAAVPSTITEQTTKNSCRSARGHSLGRPYAGRRLTN